MFFITSIVIYQKDYNIDRSRGEEREMPPHRNAACYKCYNEWERETERFSLIDVSFEIEKGELAGLF